MIFDPIDPFLLILDLFDPSFLQNRKSDWVQICIAYLNLTIDRAEKGLSKRSSS